MNQLVTMDDRQAVTTSLSVAKSFGKRHDHVLRDIENLKDGVPNFGDMFHEGESSDAYDRPRTTYFMNRLVRSSSGVSWWDSIQRGDTTC